MNLERYKFAKKQVKLFKDKLDANVMILPNTDIGKDCKIGGGTCIGYEGFGFEREEDGTPFRIPHIGKVIIGDRVEIGHNSVIARGTVGNTVIGEDVKIDDMVFIAHNVTIGDCTMIAAGAVICGSVKIGINCWIGAGCRIKEHVIIGDYATIGLGAVITHNVTAGERIIKFNERI